MNKNLIAVISLCIVPISGLAVDIYVPSLPAIAHYFQVTNATTQLTVTIYLFGYSLIQLVSGIIVDMVGTKHTTRVPLLIFTLLSIGIIYAHSIYMIFIFRLLQGVCVGFFAVSQRAIILHLFVEDKKRLSSMINYSQIVWSIGPIIAPAIGGYLERLFGWQSNFIVLAGYSLLMLILVTIFSPETSKSKLKFNKKLIIESYINILTNKKYNLSIIVLSSVYTVMILFNTTGSFIIQQKMGYSPVQFGYCALLMGAAWMSGNTINKFLDHVNTYHKLKMSVTIVAITALVALILNVFVHNLWTLLIPIAFMNLFGGIIFASYFIMTMSMFPQYAGNASGLMSMGIISFTAIGCSVFGIIILHTYFILLLVIYLILGYGVVHLNRRILKPA